MHTPDYFVLRQDSAEWVECKTSEDLEKLAIKSPNRYLPDSERNWRCPPGQVHASASELGLSRLGHPAEINWILQRNLQFLEDYLRFDPTSAAGFVNPDGQSCDSEAKPGILLSDLLAKGRNSAPKP